MREFFHFAYSSKQIVHIKDTSSIKQVFMYKV